LNKYQWLGLAFVVVIASCGFGLVGVYLYVDSKEITPAGNQTKTKTIYTLTVYPRDGIPEVFRSENRLTAFFINSRLAVYETENGSSHLIAEYVDAKSWKVETRLVVG